VTKTSIVSFLKRENHSRLFWLSRIFFTYVITTRKGLNWLILYGVRFQCNRHQFFSWKLCSAPGIVAKSHIRLPHCFNLCATDLGLIGGKKITSSDKFILHSILISLVCVNLRHSFFQKKIHQCKILCITNLYAGWIRSHNVCTYMLLNKY
jgi:hypothetical protein